MVVAVLGWGSLLWNIKKNQQRGFKIVGDWMDGPFLPIEFARLSLGEEGRRNVLILVMHSGTPPSQVFWAPSGKRELELAIENLRIREGGAAPIGWVDLVTNKAHSKLGVEPLVMQWARQWQFKGHDVDGVIWTDLGTNFEKEAHKPLSGDNVIALLSSLQGSDRREAETYIRASRPRIDTPLRRRIIRDMGWSYDPTIEASMRQMGS